jgi:uncharacterized protein YcbK (DUF882 family)
MQLTKNFTLEEFKSKDGAAFPLDVIKNIKELVINLQIIRDTVKSPLQITSGYRSPAHNKKVGGAKDSQHMKGTASDLIPKTISTKELHDTIKRLMDEGKIKQGGLKNYGGFVHYDIRGKYVTW